MYKRQDYDYAFSWMTEIGFPGISNMSVDGLCWLYSAVYNATYMLPEAILTTVLVAVSYTHLYASRKELPTILITLAETFCQFSVVMTGARTSTRLPPTT